MKTHWLKAGVAAVALASTAAAGLAYAQDQGAAQQGERGERHHGGFRGGGPGGFHHGFGGPEHRLEMLRERLHLDDNQVRLIREAFQQQMQQMRAQFEARRGQAQNGQGGGAGAGREGRGPRREAFERMRTQMEQAIDAVLTPAQRTEFDRMRAEHQQREEEHVRDMCESHGYHR